MNERKIERKKETKKQRNKEKRIKKERKKEIAIWCKLEHAFACMCECVRA